VTGAVHLLTVNLAFVSFCFRQRWVRYCINPLLHGMVSTTNGVERQHRRLKENYMTEYSSGSLIDLVTTIVQQFVPDSERKYVILLQNGHVCACVV